MVKIQPVGITSPNKYVVIRGLRHFLRPCRVVGRHRGCYTNSRAISKDETLVSTSSVTPTRCARVVLLLAWTLGLARTSMSILHTNRH